MTSSNDPDKVTNPVRRRLVKILKDAAAKAVADEDPWKKYNIPSIPAERIIRHLYHPDRKEWSTDETIVKIEREPFTHGAMRFCYRMKKRSTPPQSASNHRFHDYGWERASNYVAKAYHNKDTNDIDVSESTIAAIKNDIMLQYEASYWAEKFNRSCNPPQKITFIRAYAIEFPNRPGKPWFAVERYISGTDSYGAGFVKHNTNSGYVDTELHRVTPQVFSAHSFYASEGTRLVADIQGVGDLYTDPQILSGDYRFGDGDLGPRGMALFFKTFRHNTLSDACGIPLFQLSKNELNAQVKYKDDDYSRGSEASSTYSGDASGAGGENNNMITSLENKFAQLDANRQHRMTLLKIPSAIIEMNENIPEEEKLTERRSNMKIRDAVQQSIRKSLRGSKSLLRGSNNLVSPAHSKLITKRSKSDVDEIKAFLEIAKEDPIIEYCRKKKHNTKNHAKRSSLTVRSVSARIVPTAETEINLGKVHFQLAVLHGMGRFPDVVPSATRENFISEEEQPDHDVFSVLFHLCQAASFRNISACIAIARIQAGLESVVSDLLRTIVPIDFESAKTLLRRAMECNSNEDDDDDGGNRGTVTILPTAPRAAAGCLLYQILQDEKATAAMNFNTEDEDNDVDDSDTATTTATDSTTSSTSVTNGAEQGPSDYEIMAVIEDTLKLIAKAENEHQEIQNHKKRLKRVDGGIGFHVGDKVEGNFAMEGTYYPGLVEEVSADGEFITIKWDDDGSLETLGKDHVKHLIPPTMTMIDATSFGQMDDDNVEGGGPLSDEQALGFENTDEQFSIPIYELKAELAAIKAKHGQKEMASALYEEAADGAMNDNKMKTATEWSTKAAELLM